MTAAPWFMALRPKTLTAALVPVAVATALVQSGGLKIHWWISLFAVLSAIFIQIGTNLINDALDFKKGADTHERIGPKRVTQSGLLTPQQVMFGGALCFLLATALGLPLVIEGGWTIVAVGVASLACGYAYTGGPFPLAYVGLGDVFVIAFFGLVAVMGTFFLHAKTVTASSFVLGLQIGLLATVLIAINNLRDAPNDARVGKKTLAVRFGQGFARFEIAAFCFVPFVMGFYWAAQGHLLAALLPVLTLPLAIKVVKGVYSHPVGPVYNQFLAKSAALHLLFGLMLSIGFILS